MNITRQLKILFLLAGIVLSVKPLIGFGVIHHAKQVEVVPNHSLLRELFSRRVPDSLAEGSYQLSSLYQKLKEAGLSYSLTLCSLLFGLAYCWLLRLQETQRYLLGLLLVLVPDDHIYLTTGKLTI